MLLVGVGEIYGCGCKEVAILISSYYLSLHFLYLFFLQQHPYFLFIFLCSFLVPILFVIKLCI